MSSPDLSPQMSASAIAFVRLFSKGMLLIKALSLSARLRTLSEYPPAVSDMSMHPDVYAHNAPQKSPDNVMSSCNDVLLNSLCVECKSVAMHMTMVASNMKGVCGKWRENNDGRRAESAVPAANGSANPAMSLSAVISLYFFAKIGIFLLTLQGYGIINLLNDIIMIILVLNCGSSSLKYQLLDMKNDEVYDLLAKGLVERIGMETGCIKHQATGKEKVVKEMPIEDHTVGIKAVIDALLDKETGILSTLEDIEAVGHRVVHGAEEFVCSQLITDEVVKQIEKCVDLAPLHNPANLLGIKAVSAVLPSVPQVAVFDTAFHQTMPSYAYMYALPYEYYDKYRIRRYGFHGTSHKYVSAKGAKFAGLDINYSKIITCHLGNGSSIAAVVNGKSIDTSMGFTPLEGLIMGTRCGNIDPDVVTYLQEKEGLTPAQMSQVLNKKSGFLGLSCVSSDARDLNDSANEGNPKAKLTLKKLTYDITKFIGAYAAAMNGVDLIVFTGGIGENNSRLRRRICENLTYLGLKFDYDANIAKGEDTLLSLPDSKVKVALITTNEELMIARDTMNIVQNED